MDDVSKCCQLRFLIALFEACLLVSLVFCPILTGSTIAASTTVAKVEPSDVSADLSHTFNVSIVIADVQLLYGLEITLNWDPTMLKVMKAENQIGVEDHPGGILHEQVLVVRDNVSQDHGLYLVAAVCVNPAPSFNGTGTVAQITFNVTGEGTCELILQAELPSRSAQPISHQTINGFFGERPMQETDWRIPIIAVAAVIVLVLVAAVYLKKRR